MLSLLFLLAASPVPTGEEPVEPYVQSYANAGAQPFGDQKLWHAFGQEQGVRQITNHLVELSVADPRIAEIFKNQDLVRLRRLLFEQFCYILGGGCSYSGRDMKAGHEDLGIQTADMNALIENLQQAMRERHVSFFAQNRLLAKLAPMKRDVVER